MNDPLSTVFDDLTVTGLVLYVNWRNQFLYELAADYRKPNSNTRFVSQMAYELKDIMAREKKPTVRPTNARKSLENPIWQIARVDNDEASTEIDELAMDTDTVLDQFTHLIYDGYSFTLKRDFANDRTVAYLFCDVTGHTNYGGALSASAGDAYSAIVVLVYKHFVVLQGRYQLEKSERPRSKYG